MQWANFKALVKAHKGWIEDDRAYFPSPYLKEIFCKAYDAIEWRREEEREARDAHYYNALAKDILTRTTDYP